MTTLISRSVSARSLSLLALGTALLLAMLLALAAPAQAHDSLISSDPEDGATLETSPEAITLTFSADVLEVSPLVRITDESGTELAEIVPGVEGPTATAQLEEPLPAGTHTVQWRVVSSDGHPIEGTFTLTVEQDAAAPAAPSDGGAGEGPAVSDAGGAESTPEAASTSEATAQAADPAAQDSDGGLSMPALLGILAVIVVGAAVAGFFIVRRRS